LPPEPSRDRRRQAELAPVRVALGIDPIRHRPGLWVRIAALAIAGAGHDTLTKLMYAHNLHPGGGSIADRHIGAELMYYGGTVIDLALAIILMTQ
jgi:putative membrane protein